MKNQLLLLISAILFSSWLSGSYFYQKGQSQAEQGLLASLSGDYGQLRNTKNELDNIFSMTKGDQIRYAIYLLRNVETANASLLNISRLTINDKTDFSVIIDEVSLTAADIHTYIHELSFDLDTSKTKKKLQKHGDALHLITETLTPIEIRTMDLEKVRYKLSLLQNSLPK